MIHLKTLFNACVLIEPFSVARNDSSFATSSSITRHLS